MPFPIEIKTGFQHSEALDAYIRERVVHALAPHAHRVKRVTLRLTDANGPRRGATDKVTTVEVLLEPSGELVTTGRAGDIYESVTQAVAVARAALVRRTKRRQRRARRSRRSASSWRGGPFP